MSEVLFRLELDVRWRDLDAFEHVNNASFLTYLEEARLSWMDSLPGPWMDEARMPLLASVKIDYRRPIEWPARIAVLLGVERIGRSSLSLAHRVVAAEDASCAYADGSTTMVWVARDGSGSVPLPEAVRAACEGVQHSPASSPGAD
jgi:acyl-CoA thioester hydrolase